MGHTGSPYGPGPCSASWKEISEKYDLFADITALERTVYGPFLPLSGLSSLGSHSLTTFCFAAARTMLCRDPSSNGFFYLPIPHPSLPLPRNPSSKGEACSKAELIGQSTTLVLCHCKGSWARANPWGFSLGKGEGLPGAYRRLPTEHRKQSLFWGGGNWNQKSRLCYCLDL